MLQEDVAAKCFNENRNLFSNPNTEPEKFNLYNGLENMAIMIKDLLSRVDNLERELKTLRRDL